MPAATNSGEPTARHRPKALTVFAAAFVAGAAAAVGVNRLLDVHIARSKPQIECEPIFVALRSLPQGAPVTVWDVALRDWPKAMLPGSALRAHDPFEGLLLRHPLREGQPLLSVQLMRPGSAAGLNAAPAPQEAFVPPVPAATTVAPPAAQADLWTPDEPIRQAATVAARPPAAVGTTDIPAPAPAPSPAQTTSQPTAQPTAAKAMATDATPAKPAVGQVADQRVPDTDEIRDPEAEAAAAVAAVPTPAQPDDVAAGTSADTANDAANEPADDAAAAGAAATADIDAAEPTDPATLPSVVTSKGGEQAPPVGEPVSAQPRRYLVVPERIALQADSSFSTPPPATSSPSPATPSAALAAPTAAAPAGSSSAPDRQPAVTPRQQTQPNLGERTQPGRAQQAQPGEAQQAQPGKAQQAQPAKGKQIPPGRAQQVQPSRGKPAQSPQRNRPAPATSTRVAPQRTWDRPFPNVAAGLEAIGQQWQQVRSGDDTIADAAAGAADNDRRR